MTEQLVQNLGQLIKVKKADAFKHQAIIDESLRSNRKYTDPEFPPEESSLIRRLETPAKWKSFIWRRASEFMNRSQMKVFNVIEPNDIIQGQLGDCYFLSCLSVLAERPKLIERLFLTEEVNDAGCYAVWLNDNGQWKNFIIDDYFPCLAYNKGPAFSRSNGPELWVLLLEKAYAKMYGSYDIIEGGDPAWALRDLTGAPWDFLDSTDPNEVWNFVHTSESNNYLLTCYTRSTDIREEQNPLGIVFGHAYSILDAKEIITETGIERLIRIRNPWGKFEWKGDWGDESDKWTGNIKAQVNYENKDDGTFWMSVNDFVKYYEGVGICKLCENYLYKSIDFDHKGTGKNHTVFRLVVREKTHIFLSVNQKDDRSFDPAMGYQYSTIRMMLGRVEGNGVTYVDGKFFNDRNLVLENTLERGYYIITVEFLWRQNIHQAANLSAYCEKSIDFEEVLKGDINVIQRNLLKSFLFQTGVKQKPYTNIDAGNISKYSGSHLGMIYFYYNNEDDEKKLHETVKPSKLSNMQIQAPFTNSEEYTIEVMPRDDAMVIYKIMDEREGFALTPKPNAFTSEPPYAEIEANRANAYRTTTYIDDPTDKDEASRDVSYYDDFIRNNVNAYPDDPTNLAEILKKDVLDMAHPGQDVQIELTNQFGAQRKNVAGGVTREVSLPQVSSLYDTKLWENFPSYIADDSRLGKWAILGFERSFCDLVNPIFSSKVFDKLFLALMSLFTILMLLISLLRPQFVDIVILTSLISLVVSRFSVFRVFQENNLALRMYPFFLILSSLLDLNWLFVYGKNWPENDITDDDILARVKSSVISLSYVQFITKLVFALLLWWKVIVALKDKK